MSAAKYMWSVGGPEYTDIKKVIARLEDATDSTSLLPQQENIQKEEGCFYKTGIVTIVTNEYVLIDEKYLCDKININVPNIKVGDKVYYLAFQLNKYQEMKIYKIMSVVDSTWDCEEDKDGNKIVHAEQNILETHIGQTIRKTVLGKVVRRLGRTVYIDPNNIILNLDNIDSTFVPINGDWVKLEATFEVDHKINDFNGAVLQVQKIMPLRTKITVGIVTSFETSSGVGSIDKSIVFIKPSCDPGYIPCIGDKVVSDSIESDQCGYMWRSLSVVPLEQVSLYGYLK